MQYEKPDKASPIKPRIIIHGGAGNITRANLPPHAYTTYQKALLSILSHANRKLHQTPNASALDVATYAVRLLEDNSLFNAGRGAVYTTAGTHELEASVMVSRGYRKRGVGVMNVRQARSPVQLAREMLVRGKEEWGGGGGAQGHNQLQGETCDRLNREWGLECVRPSYFWTRKRWDEHRRGLGLGHDDETYERHRREADAGAEAEVEWEREAGVEAHVDADIVVDDDPSWNGRDYLPQGTVGCVVLDSSGMLCVATSTGGMTNKLPGRIGDTPTIGAGFWAEQWYERKQAQAPPTTSWLRDCLPSLRSYVALDNEAASYTALATEAAEERPRAVAMSGTGNGDSFLRINAVRTTAAIARYASTSPSRPLVPLQSAVTAVAGPHGQLQQSAGDRWGKTSEGEGGIIGIELRDGKGHVAYDHCCGGMFRAWIDDCGNARFGVFQDEKSV